MVELTIEGMNELRAALQALPADLAAEGSAIVHAQAAEAMRKMYAAYPEDTGALKRGLIVDPPIDDAAHATTITRVRNRTWYTGIWEYGTHGKHRRWRAGKDVGPMPAGNVFIPNAQRQRALMVSALVNLVQKAGFQVQGVAGEL